LFRKRLDWAIDNANCTRGEVDRIHSIQRRCLVTAITTSPRLTDPKNNEAAIARLPLLVDSALAWASRRHPPHDPPTHAIVLIRKPLIPRGKGELIKALSETNELAGLNALVGVVDTVGGGATGVSVLVASKSEGVTIDTLKGLQNEALRVGKWHAKDVEDDNGMNFDDVLASIRQGKEVPTAAVSMSQVSGKDLAFVIGEMEGVQNHASKINEKCPRADIV
jgi:hypothetical protein